jgi:hypothetical protein
LVHWQLCDHLFIHRFIQFARLNDQWKQPLIVTTTTKKKRVHNKNKQAIKFSQQGMQNMQKEESIYKSVAGKSIPFSPPLSLSFVCVCSWQVSPQLIIISSSCWLGALAWGSSSRHRSKTASGQTLKQIF